MFKKVFKNRKKRIEEELQREIERRDYFINSLKKDAENFLKAFKEDEKDGKVEIYTIVFHSSNMRTDVDLIHDSNVRIETLNKLLDD